MSKLYIIGVFNDRGERSVSEWSGTKDEIDNAVVEWIETGDVEDDIFLYWMINTLYQESGETARELLKSLDYIFDGRKTTIVGEEMSYGVGATRATAIEHAFYIEHNMEL